MSRRNGRRPMGSTRQALVLVALFLLSLGAGLAPPTAAHLEQAAESTHEHVVISEFLVSASSKDYNGTDWNGDGYYGSDGDQFIELYNPTPFEANISGWWLDDDPEGGSPRCQIGWGTLLQPGERMAFYRAKTGIELDYWDGDVIRLENSWGDLVDSASFPAEHSYWDNSYGRAEDGTWERIGSPTPGSPNNGTYVGPNHLQGSCYTVRDHIHEGQYILKGRVVTMNSADAVLDRGNVFVKDGVIQAVWEDGQPPGADVWSVPEIDTGGSIYPGLIDMHNHIHYNMLPLWDYPVEGGFYTNRYQWKNNPDYKPSVTWPKNLVHSGPYWNLEESAVKYAEMKEIAGGTTAVQGGPSSDDESFSWILARNIEYYNFGRDEMHTKVTELDSDYIGAHITNGNASGELDGWFLHLSEGTDASSLDEFRILQESGLLVGETLIIHGVPLREAEYQAMAAVGSSLIWSPTSNLLLYGDTAKVDLAKAAGVNIALAPDWAPSGTKSPLHELKTADWWNQNKMGGLFSDYELVQMVTSNAADAMNWGPHVGRIGVGKAADLVVIDSFADDPYRNLIQAIDPDVRLTIAGGLPLFGDVDLMTLLKGDDKEIVQGDGFQKALDITFSGVPLGQDTWATIESSLTTALNFDPEVMYGNWSESSNHESVASFESWFSQQYPGLDPIQLDPIFTYGDQRYFSVLNRSEPFNSQDNLSLWDNYYDVSFDTDGNRTGGWTAPPPPPSGWPPSSWSRTSDDSQAPRLWTKPDEVPLSLCSLDQAQRDSAGIPTGGDGQVLLCGAVTLKREQADGCWEEVWVDNQGVTRDDSMLVWQEPCPEGTTWTEAHAGMSEKPQESGHDLVSRADPAHLNHSMIAFPGQTCDSQNVAALEPPIGNGEAYWKERVSNWQCVDIWVWHGSITPPPDDGNGGNGDDNGNGMPAQENDVMSRMFDPSSPLYWLMVLMTLSIFGGAVAMMVQFTRRGGEGGAGDTAIGTPDLGLEPPFG